MVKKLTVREAGVGDNRRTLTFDSQNFDIIADDGRPLFGIRVLDNGTLEVSASMVVRHKGKMLDDRLAVRPRSSNAVSIQRDVYAE